MQNIKTIDDHLKDLTKHTPFKAVRINAEDSQFQLVHIANLNDINKYLEGKYQIVPFAPSGYALLVDIGRDVYERTFGFKTETDYYRGYGLIIKFDANKIHSIDEDGMVGFYDHIKFHNIYS